MSNRAYYDDLLNLAREKRTLYGVNTSAFGLKQVKLIYKAEGILIDYYPLPYKVKAVYMCDDKDCSVAIQKALPDEPKLFALVHELKHHYRDQEIIRSSGVVCGDYNANQLIEKGAEVFAAEFIYPEAEFVFDLEKRGIKQWTAEEVVRFKRDCKAKVSYRFICKRLERLQLVGLGEFNSVQFQKLEEQLFGIPFYRQRYRRRAA
jgi:Zn-dependent peptidase ImmA (M78 family)